MNKKIKITIFIVLFMFAIVIFCKKSEAAEYIWPIGGDNASETTVDYEFYGSKNANPIKDGKSGREYIVDNKKWPQEKYYYASCESHYGMDIAGIYGHTYTIVSVTDGIVIATSGTRLYNPSINYIDRNQRRTSAGLIDGGGYGNYIIIQETSTGRCFLYAHLKAGTITVQKGQQVSTGQQLAIMGSSGDSGHTHLHFEIRKSKDKCFIEYSNGKHALVTTNTNSNLDPMLYIEKNASQEVKDKKRVQLNNIQMELYIKYLYSSVLNRTVNSNEIRYYLKRYDENKSIADITKLILLSTEANNKIGNLSNLDFVKKTYEVILYRGKNYTEQEMSGHVNKLNTGVWDKENYLNMLCNSDEFVNIKINSILKNEGRKDIKYIVLSSNISRLGDYDGNGIINFFDSTYCLKLCTEINANYSEYEYSHLLKYLDVNGDGRISKEDSNCIKEYILKRETENNVNLTLETYVRRYVK